ncbi:hypothetical protein [Paenibacillus glucanolyticus]|uniref:hypothetical protein n=1 Tax=Paenibacillus glucanolyticus TaxID=59843 RepID=UPI00096F44D6|nr:hypothetical protein [Paenibacillus glucanolyticus]OMF70493.1 hypothetical protein BK142_23760 [Paenibacillus glucanolyticus]
MTELFELYDRHATRLGLKIEMYHSNIVDWRITIENPNGELIVNVQHCDYKYVLAKAEVGLKEWLSENNGGY